MLGKPELCRNFGRRGTVKYKCIQMASQKKTMKFTKMGSSARKFEVAHSSGLQIHSALQGRHGCAEDCSVSVCALGSCASRESHQCQTSHRRQVFTSETERDGSFALSLSFVIYKSYYSTSGVDINDTRSHTNRTSYMQYSSKKKRVIFLSLCRTQ